MRPRVLLYAVLLTVVGSIMLAAFAMRSDLEVNVLRDRTPLYVTLADGSIRNGYTLKILNKARENRAYRLTLAGLTAANVSVVGIPDPSDSGGAFVLQAKPDSVATFRVYVSVPRSSLHGDSMPLVFDVRTPDGREAASYHAVFLGPGK